MITEQAEIDAERARVITNITRAWASGAISVVQAAQAVTGLAEQWGWL